ncbi:Panacea domain-containing protein [Aerococcus sp. L_32]|uniref:Panacea domain-containing protein n=1 Tax=Aerococcus sp. L_32 TaxID=3422316 RepID=UPI003D6A23EC
MYTANQVSDWFLVKHSSEMQTDDANDEYLTQMKLHKLLYYAQGVNLALFSEKLFSEDLLAWRHGPVVREVYERFKGQREIGEEISDEELENYEEISDDLDNRMVLEVVYETFGGYSAAKLRNMTHEETPWIEAYESRNENDVISESTIKTYFENHIVEK